MHAAGSIPPRRVAGRYLITDQLGSGAMGTVWSGYDEVLRRRGAVKELAVPPDVPRADAASADVASADVASAGVPSTGVPSTGVAGHTSPTFGSACCARHARSAGCPTRT